MNLEIEATYENGALKPALALPLLEGEKVTLTIQPVARTVGRFSGSLRWTRDPEELHSFLNDPEQCSWGSRDV